MFPRTLATTSIAAAIVVGGLWLSSCLREPLALRADPPPADADTDDDFLPDRIEWVCLTSASRADTDADGTSDFVEVVQQANPRIASSPMPEDHEMRIVVTSEPTPAGSVVTMHLLFRFMGQTSLLTNLNAWCEIAAAPGLRFPLDAVTSGPISISQRLTASDGLWVRVSAPLVSESFVVSLLPCTVGADATIGSRVIDTKTALINRGGAICGLVNFSQGFFALQPINAPALPAGGTVSNNRICVLQLELVGGGSGGAAFEVVAAECQDCNDLSCGAECPASVGSILILPAGSGAITGG